jgi:hypothetical protein
MRDPRIKDGELIEAGLDKAHEVPALRDPTSLKGGPVAERRASEEHRFTPREAAGVPIREGEDERPWAMHIVAVQLLPAATCRHVNRVSNKYHVISKCFNPLGLLEAPTLRGRPVELVRIGVE